LFEFPNTRRAVLEILEKAGVNAGTRKNLTHLPFHHLVMMPGSEQPHAPFATHRFQIRTFADSPDAADDAALSLKDVIAGGPYNTSHGQIDEIRRTATPVEIDTDTDTHAQFNAVYEAAVRAI
jgi:hypothetical protein